MKRHKGETLEQYKERRSQEQTETRAKLRPKMFWDSAKLGTYRRSKEKQ